MEDMDMQCGDIDQQTFPVLVEYQQNKELEQHSRSLFYNNYNKFGTYYQKNSYDSGTVDKSISQISNKLSFNKDIFQEYYRNLKKNFYDSINHDEQPFYRNVYIDGNIGSGKTSAINQYKILNNKAEAFLEPIGEWTNANGVNVLERSYTQPKEFNIIFQYHIMMTKHLKNIRCINDSLQIHERSFFADNHIFAKRALETGNISNEQYQVYNFGHQIIQQEILSQLHKVLFIYIRTDPDISLQRVQKRNRKEEKSINLQFLTDYSLRHDQFYDYKEKTYQKLQQKMQPVVQLNQQVSYAIIDNTYLTIEETAKQIDSTIKIWENQKSN